MKKKNLIHYFIIISFILLGCISEDINLSVEKNNEIDFNKDNLIRDYKNYIISDEDNYILKSIELDRTFENPWAIEFINDDELIISEKNGNLIYVNMNTN